MNAKRLLELLTQAAARERAADRCARGSRELWRQGRREAAQRWAVRAIDLRAEAARLREEEGRCRRA